MGLVVPDDLDWSLDEVDASRAQGFAAESGAERGTH
jgi:hypothetical protein